MTKITTYKCDACGITSNKKEPLWIMLGSGSGKDFKMRNKASKSGHMEMNIHEDIHICGKYCLVKFFFGRSED